MCYTPNRQSHLFLRFEQCQNTHLQQMFLHSPLDTPHYDHSTTTICLTMMKDFSIKFSSTIGKLNEGDWLQWSHEISMALRAQRGWGYVDSTMSTLKDTLELSEWNAAYDKVIGALGMMVEASLQCELESINNAKMAWGKLKEKTHSKGIIYKLEYLLSTICSCIVSNISAST